MVGVIVLTPREGAAEGTTRRVTYYHKEIFDHRSERRSRSPTAAQGGAGIRKVKIIRAGGHRESWTLLPLVGEESRGKRILEPAKERVHPVGRSTT